MVTIGIARWTPKTGHEMGKRFENWKPLPDFIKVSGPYMYTAGDEGLKSITIFKYDKEKAGEASEAISSTYMIFYGVPGYRYSLNIASGADATMKMMGLG